MAAKGPDETARQLPVGGFLGGIDSATHSRKRQGRELGAQIGLPRQRESGPQRGSRTGKRRHRGVVLLVVRVLARGARKFQSPEGTTLQLDIRPHPVPCKITGQGKVRGALGYI